MRDYSIGIDLGTNSSGISVITDDFKLLKVKNKNLWSVVKITQGETAEARRIKRGTRRLLTRRKWRINNFRMLIEEEIMKSDPTFFHRLEDSFKHKEDRRDKSYDFNLFIEKNFNDRDYFRNYPTIYHLRNKLIEDKRKYDIRLIYMAIHHIIKYRGHFLYEGEDFSKVIGNNEDLIDELISNCSTYLDISINNAEKNIYKILEDKNKSRKDKINEILTLEKYIKEDKIVVKEIFNGILGLSMDIGKLLPDIDFGELKKINMSDSDIDEKFDTLSNLMGENFVVLETVKKLYSGLKLKDILSGTDYVSAAMIGRFNKFKYDLNLLKKVIRENCTENVYFDIFKSIKKDEPNYNNYINNKIKANGNKKRVEDKKKVFYDKLKSILKDVENQETDYILSEIENENFLIKLNTTINSIIPYQLQLKELEEILENQGEFYPILRENKDKIIKILTFRIPYYIGPLDKNQNKKYGWIEMNKGKEGERIFPWNFNDVVDIEKSAEGFITRMTSYCSYLPSEKVLPFNSILYTEYLYYNEVNKIRFGDNTLDSTEKEILKQELFMNYNNVSEQKLLGWYKKRYPAAGNIKVTGFIGDKKASVTLKPIKDFTRIYGKITKDNIEEIERIIYYLTVFEDKRIIKRKLNTEFKLNDKAKKEILQLNYSGWGRLSAQLLNGIKVRNGKYIKKSIIDILKETNLNFMQIINDSNLGFNKIIEEKNGSDKIEKINFEEHIKTLQGSPAIKKGIYQAVKQIEEVIKLTGKYPKSIYIEVAREDGKSKRTLARNKKLLDLYEGIEALEDKDKEIIKKLKEKGFKIDNERLYLYCMQRGKCMYSGRPLEISNLIDYEVDHIIPRSLIKDDSFSNKVLVIKEYNQKKSSGALEDKIINNMAYFWKSLLDYKLISKRKFDNLTNRTGIFEKEAEKGFINRQLVEVRQISKHVVNLLNRAYGDKGTKVYAIKAELVNNFKKQFNIYKSREINDLHHVKDAYAVAVVGEYIKKRFRNLDSEFIYDEYKQYLKKITCKNKFGFIISSMTIDFINEDGVVVWDAKSEISKIKKIFEYNDPFVVKKTEVMTGQLFNLTRYDKNGSEKNENKIPLKNNKDVFLDPCKYGYYTSLKISYCSLIKIKDKNKYKNIIAKVPITMKDKIGKSTDKLIEYFQNKGYEVIEILIPKIPIYQKIVYEGHEYYIISEKEWCNAKQLKISSKYYNNICNLNDPKYFKELEKNEKKNQLIEIFDYLLEKLEKEYKNAYKKAIKDLNDKREDFINLNSDSKLYIINQILNLTKADSSKADLSKLKCSKEAGKLNGKEGKDMTNVIFVYESYLGINKREVKY
ncbi:type II CRISPR RNA-guided endonuclease Cas9 [Clostridium weizhouense]|uniref:CRISPR-associated endonuclease Cas9 n=1 Tax=Clostridium weizhouense TaxID=2859781 RepID=A0ABS7AM72_9CLOT|nr:type II CRISPR RNA-guided endonuclease Cas9 [Clostridium weizhouense]MBW6409669.1 type II CRISPR RNA-guided endonuclease Cas9 [Clostridium weizhouense]